MLVYVLIAALPHVRRCRSNKMLPVSWTGAGTSIAASRVFLYIPSFSLMNEVNIYYMRKF